MAKFAITSTSKPSSAQLSTINTQMSNEIDVALSASGVAVPVTSPAAFLGWLVLLNAYGAAAAVLQSMFPDGSGPANARESVAFWEKRYQTGLAGIKDGSLIPPDALTNAGALAPSTYFTRNPDDEEDIGALADPFFRRDKVF